MKKTTTLAFIKGIVVTLFVFSLMMNVSASKRSVKATLDYNDIKICIDGNYITPKDAGGNVVEPFIINGTTYLPVRAVASALGKEVDWDGNTRTVFLGEKPETAVAANGTRSAPYSAKTGVTVLHNTYSWYPTLQIKLTCNTVIKGEAGNLLASKFNGFNDTPSANQEWMIFDLELSLLSSSEGEDSKLSASSVIYKDFFYKPDGSKLNVSDTATISSLLSGYSASNVEMYPGGSSRVIYGILTDKYDGDILLKVPYEEGSKNTWIKLNSSDNVITSASSLNSYLEESVPEAEQGVKITLKNSLPTTISNYSYSNKLESTYRITDWSYTSTSTSATVSFSGQKTYDVNGSGQSRAVKIGWKLYDSEGYVVDDGTAYGSSIKENEKFKNCDASLYSLEPGTYTIEIMSVN